MSQDPTLVAACRDALSEAMGCDPSISVFGEDVAAGGPFGLTKGLAESLGPDRVRNTPICEGSFLGAGIGFALAGGRPFVDLMFSDFVTAASDQLFNHAAKIHYMSGGRCSVPLTVWTVAGAGTRWGAQHSQRLDGWFAQVPGLKVLAPSSPAMARSSLRAALADPDPVVVIVDRSLLYSRAHLPHDDGSPWEPRVVRPGRDLTVVTSGRLVHLALGVAEQMAADVEVVDLQRIAPLDVSVVLRSLRTTARLVVAHDEAGPGALGAAVESRVHAEGFWSLCGPVLRVSSPPTPVPAAASLEDAYMIDADLLRRTFEEALTHD